MVGSIVCSKSGRDKGYFLVVIKEEDGFLYVCDGKERPLSQPKRKNPKHLAFTQTVLDKSSYSSNKSLRRALAVYRDSASKGRNRDV